ncbi:MAG: TIGR02171 family protein [Fibrobacter sp.]|nr:TIGR02171 family protein [Fibrobacter sp.]
MKIFGALVLFFLLANLNGCSNSTGAYEKKEGERISVLDSLDLKDMIPVRSFGENVTLGTNSDKASSHAKPSMKVSFDYDYFIGKHEVTCAEMGLSCGGSLPAVNVTYFDAILYANKRSIAEGFDTAYTYTGATFDNEGACVNLDGLVFLPTVNAYRLPTEAEWVYAASLGWVPDSGWNADNSDYRTHEVCSSFIDGSGLCDMAGNVMEWVNDWYVTFRKEPVADFVGGVDGGVHGERVVKGGSYRNSAATTYLYTRGDIYTVTSVSKAEYVGFRLAFGAIGNPMWLDEDGRQKNIVISVLASSMDMRHELNTNKVKVAFRDDETGNLAYVDYSEDVSSVVEIDDTLEVYHPDISPDGNWVAFCTGLEGVSGKSSVYVRMLDSAGSGLVRLDVENAAIPRWRVLANGDTVIVYVTDAGNNRDESAFMRASTWQVQFADGKFGTPEKLFDGAYHGGVSRDGSLAVSGARLLRARVASRDTLWYNGEQACNASLSRDKSKRTLFLDFAGTTGHKFVGEDYATHEVILFADSAGALERFQKAPAGYTFDHTEWVVGEDSLVVATLVDSDGAHRKVVLLNAYTGELFNVLRGEELWHPAVWMNERDHSLVDPDLDLDSAGVYYTPEMDYYALELRVKMERFWKLRDSVTAVVLGSSRVMFGVNESFVESETLLNMGYSSGDIYGMEYLTMNYVLRHMPQLKFLVLEFSPDFMWVTEEVSWAPMYVMSPGIRYDESHDFWVDSVPKGFVLLVEDSYKTRPGQMLPYSFDEFMLPAVGWGEASIAHDSVYFTLDLPSVKKNRIILQNIVNAARERGVQVVLLVPPQNPGYAETGVFGIYSMRRSAAQELLEWARTLDVLFLDENKMGYHDYDSSMAFNTDHLSREGARQLSTRLDSLFRAARK